MAIQEGKHGCKWGGKKHINQQYQEKIFIFMDFEIWIKTVMGKLITKPPKQYSNILLLIFIADIDS